MQPVYHVRPKEMYLPNSRDVDNMGFDLCDCHEGKISRKYYFVVKETFLNRNKKIKQYNAMQFIFVFLPPGYFEL